MLGVFSTVHCALFKALQRYYACYIVVNETLPVSVSLTCSGLPRIIPRRHRHCISCGDERADEIVRLYNSWFGLSRIIELAALILILKRGPTNGTRTH
uniref:Uncharacterized protein n=1 Tax=Utricularia reniformis TaxID=192314 RepID=A0A1Y0AZM2_9LAMI|nr:hypothetical protein AEK19_MT0303 [Utricularia reniformis]ART30578.1 hypothetical protein AEK19_MT0303 [Utricularia reniformis]